MPRFETPHLSFLQAFFYLTLNLITRCLKETANWTQIIPCTAIPASSLSGNPHRQRFKGSGTSQQLLFLQSCCVCDSYAGVHLTHPAAPEPGLYLCAFTIKPCCSVGTSARLCSTQTPHTFFSNLSFYGSGCFSPAAMYTFDM